ncbi:MAG: DUF480 domain-containing protein [Gemmataceae bacterium]
MSEAAETKAGNRSASSNAVCWGCSSKRRTPEAYPMSLNGLTTGSNQKSNRDPVMNVTDDDIEQSLQGLQKKGLVVRITGGRVDRFKHQMYAVWEVEKVELAILAELLLRGPQTEGELRSRASRMEPIEDLPALRAQLTPLANRKLVVFLGPEGRRGTLITHGFHDPAELARIRATAPTEESASRPATASSASAEPRSELADLRREVDELKETVRRLEANLNDLQAKLGGS